ncbi:tyrosine-type recombinase/integrase [Membranihabitans marinus]|uniref:tyrosine-type recombinase/integrase n=1 Tax=Membranihabitans marinus TaxID=1227546 RepID=UPI001F015349|nr:tyrosine-type recombinase/integrase [Membranihabitans marinus]
MDSKIIRFLDYIKYEKRYSDNTIVAYRKDLNQFKSFLDETFGEMDWAEVSHLNVRSWVFHLSELSSDKRTINRKISSLRSFYKYLFNNQIVSSHPLQHIQSVKVGKSLPVVVPTEAIDKYINAPSESWQDLRDQMLIQVLYETGMRRAEVMKLTFDDIRWDRQQIRVLGKGNKWRIIPLRVDLVDKLTKYREEIQAQFDDLTPYIIVRDNGKPAYPKWIYNKVKQIIDVIATTEKSSPHILRHSIATHLLDNGADVRIIKEFLGHSSMASTEIYTHNSIEKLKAAYKSSLPNLDRIIL